MLFCLYFLSAKRNSFLSFQNRMKKGSVVPSFSFQNSTIDLEKLSRSTSMKNSPAARKHDFFGTKLRRWVSVKITDSGVGVAPDIRGMAIFIFDQLILLFTIKMYIFFLTSIFLFLFFHFL